jgi:hypothetical protein
VDDIRDIADRLTENAEALVEELLPWGRREGAEWHCRGSASPTGYAISVVLRGHKRGVVGFWGGDKRGGSLLDLICAVHGFRFREALTWAKNYLGIEEGERKAADPALAEAAAKRKAQRLAREAKEIARRVETAKSIWNRGVSIKGTPAERYLIGRGLTPRDWPTLRFVKALEWEHGSIWQGERKVAQGPTFPALVAAVQSVDRKLTGVWRIYLTDEGTKAPVSPNKVGKGDIGGGAVRFGPAAETIAVAEGIETALAVDELCGWKIPTWSCLSTSGMVSIIPPPEVKHVCVYPDGDLTREDKSGNIKEAPGIAAARQLAARLKKEGIGCEVMNPPETLSGGPADYLDVLRVTREITSPK